jgi:hypothetical protein
MYSQLKDTPPGYEYNLRYLPNPNIINLNHLMSPPHMIRELVTAVTPFSTKATVGLAAAIPRTIGMLSGVRPISKPDYLEY